MAMNIINLVRRDAAVPASHTMISLLIVLLALLIATVLLVGALLFFRHRRRAQKALLELPLYDEKRLSTSSTSSHHRRIMIRPSESVYVIQEKQSLIDNSNSPPGSPIPEIRITFPEEVDEAGKRTSGRVVVVRVGETSVGLEPLAEKLPAYQQSETERFQSLDLDRIGGLNEKDSKQWS